MFLNSIFLVLSIFPSSFRGCQEVSNISFVFCNLCHFLFFPSPFFEVSFCLDRPAPDGFPMESGCCRSYMGWDVNWELQKKSWKTTNLTSGSFFWNLCRSILKKPSTHFTVSLEFLGASSDKDFQRQGAETLALKTQAFLEQILSKSKLRLFDFAHGLFEHF